MLVHFPIALLLASVFLDVLGVWRRNDRLTFAGFCCLVLGTVGGLFAFVSGVNQAERMVQRFMRFQEAMAAAGTLPAADLGERLMQAIAVHRLFALALVALFALLTLWRVRLKGALSGRTVPAYLTLAALGVVLVVATGWYGGRLTEGAGFPRNQAGAPPFDRGPGGDFGGAGGAGANPGGILPAPGGSREPTLPGGAR